MVCTSQPLASMIGNQVLQQGGNAADAAVAIAAALSVLEPFSTGLGGDMFALYFDANKKRVFGINGSGRSGMASSLDLAKSLFPNAKKIPRDHGLSVTVPGAVAGWSDMLSHWGTRSLASVLEPAIGLARNGFPVSQVTQHWWQEEVLTGHYVDSSSVFSPPPTKPGTICFNTELASLLERIGKMGKMGFYQGEVARTICSAVKARGGVLCEEDFLTHESTMVEPISLAFEQVKVFECPPNGQGLVALLALDTFQRLKGLSLPRNSPEQIHLMIECLRTSFIEAQTYICDPACSPVSADQLMHDETYVGNRLKRVKLDEASMQGKPATTSDTVSFQVVDKFGNAISMVNSTYQGFGSGICPQGLGLSLQNRACNFSLNPDSANVLAPRKRPYHTIIPGMTTSLTGDQLHASFTVMGGFMQPQGHFQVLVNLVGYGDSVQEALDAPRFCVMDDGRVALEDGLQAIGDKLQSQFGHQVYTLSGYSRALFGRGQIVHKDAQGVLHGGSDGRADGCAIPGL